MSKVQFEWDAEKDALNQQKHGVSFSTAQYAFADERRVIAQDVGHSQNEARFYCFGEVAGGHFNGAVYLSGGGDSDYWRGILAERKGNL